jgi:hypothetical protein
MFLLPDATALLQPMDQGVWTIGREIIVVFYWSEFWKKLKKNSVA